MTTSKSAIGAVMQLLQVGQNCLANFFYVIGVGHVRRFEQVYQSPHVLCIVSCGLMSDWHCMASALSLGHSAHFVSVDFSP